MCGDVVRQGGKNLISTAVSQTNIWLGGKTLAPLAESFRMVVIATKPSIGRHAERGLFSKNKRTK